MRHRIRVAGIIKTNNKILLVKHVDPQTQFEWWVPPGGGLEDTDLSIHDALMREIFEETGLTVKVSKDPVFIREFYDDSKDVLNLELFFEVIDFKGDLTIENIYGNVEDELYIKDLKWFDLEEVQHIVVFPELTKNNFGKDEENIYIGRQK